MTVLSQQSIVVAKPIDPMTKRAVVRGRSYGLSHAGYDIRIDQDLIMWPGRFVLASAMERFQMPDNLLGVVHDKSSWARRGLSVLNTVIEPGWKGYLTLEIKLLACSFLRLRRGDPIAQIVFHRLDEPTVSPYRGKYQDQAQGPQKAREEPSHRPVVRPEIIWPDMQFTYRPFDDYGGGRDFKPDGGVGW
jgi:dCTP deaminase